MAHLHTPCAAFVICVLSRSPSFDELWAALENGALLSDLTPDVQIRGTHPLQSALDSIQMHSAHLHGGGTPRSSDADVFADL